MARSFKKQLGVAAGIGVLDMGASVVATSGEMHRGLTHKAWQPGPLIEQSSRFVLWGNGMIRRKWAQAHRRHHEYADIEGDPHSPVLKGMRFIALRNHLEYRKEVNNISDEDLDADLKPDEYDNAIYDKSKTGLATSFLGHIALNKIAGNPAYMAGVSWSIGKASYILAGNAVNSLGHGGKNPLKALVTNRITPHEDGTYGADNPVLAALTGGEGNQKFHHEHPESLMFNDRKNIVTRSVLDVVGTAATIAIRAGLGKPSATPPTPEPASHAPIKIAA